MGGWQLLISLHYIVNKFGNTLILSYFIFFGTLSCVYNVVELTRFFSKIKVLLWLYAWWSYMYVCRNISTYIL